MEKSKQKNYVVITMIINFLANIRIYEESGYHYPVKHDFDLKTFLIITIFIISVTHLKRKEAAPKNDV